MTEVTAARGRKFEVYILYFSFCNCF